MLDVGFKLERSIYELELCFAICIRFKAFAYHKRQIRQNPLAEHKV